MLSTNFSTTNMPLLRSSPFFYSSKPSLPPTTRCSSSSGDSGAPAEEFGRLAAAFRRRLVVGAAAASFVAVGANFGGLTSLLLGISPDAGRALRLDVLYPVKGFTRCLDLTNGFEFIYPSSWVGDQTLLYREASKAESQRSLDPPPLPNGSPRPTRYVNEPVKAFGPPGSNGELNVSVIVSPVTLDFKIEAFGGPKEVGQLVLKRIARSKNTDIKVTLIDASLREDADNEINYYKLEFRVESPSFRRHNVALCCVKNGKLYTFNAQAPESAWIKVRRDFCEMADSFSLISSV